MSFGCALLLLMLILIRYIDIHFYQEKKWCGLFVDEEDYEDEPTYKELDKIGRSTAAAAAKRDAWMEWDHPPKVPKVERAKREEVKKCKRHVTFANLAANYDLPRS
jgi:hypothetical protein